MPPVLPDVGQPSVAGAGSPAPPALPQRDVHGPVVAPGGELPGPVERVDDPHPVGIDPRQVVDGLFGQHRVGGPLARQAVEDQRVGPLVPGVAEVIRVPETLLLPHLQ